MRHALQSRGNVATPLGVLSTGRCPSDAAKTQCPHRLVVRTSCCGRDNPGSNPGVDRAGCRTAPSDPCFAMVAAVPWAWSRCTSRPSWLLGGSIAHCPVIVHSAILGMQPPPARSAPRPAITEQRGHIPRGSKHMSVPRQCCNLSVQSSRNMHNRVVFICTIKKSRTTRA